MKNDKREMVGTISRCLAALLLSVSALVLIGCPEKEGPLEKAGKKLDNATDSVKDAAEDVGDELGDAGREISDAVEDAAEDGGN